MSEETTTYKQLTKVCSCCHQVKPVTEFHRNRDGYQSQCKVCRRKNMAAKKEKAIADKRAAADSVALASYTPRQLMEELKRRGYRWTDMTYVMKISYDNI